MGWIGGTGGRGGTAKALFKFGLCVLAVLPILPSFPVLPFLPVLPSAFAQSQSIPPPASRVPVYHYAIVHSYPHDPDAFTEGLEYRDGFLYESTGLNGKSSIRKVKIETGEVLQQKSLSRDYFGEGITFWKNDLFQLTWITEIGFVYDSKTFESKRSVDYKGEGWALTHNAESLIMSDGSTQLRFLDPATFRERKRITVMDAGMPIKYLNELEWVNGEIFANVYTTDYIARIDPSTGRVTGWIDVRGMLPHQNDGNTVPNGIAYDAEHNRLFVTGKNWQKTFEIRLVP